MTSFADLLGVGIEVEQDARRYALVLAHQPEQDVLGADVVVTQRQRLAQRHFEHLLRAPRGRVLRAPVRDRRGVPGDQGRRRARDRLYGLTR